MILVLFHQRLVALFKKAAPMAAPWIVVAAGAESEGELAHRAAVAVAERLGTEPVTFPSGHGGFLGGEYGQMGAPEPFASKLRQVLTAAA